MPRTLPLSRPLASFALLAASLAVAAPATMPERGVLPDRPGQRLERVLALDDLTADQRKQIESILADARSDLDRARSTTAPAARGIIRDAVDRARARIAAALTPAQRDRLRAAIRDDDLPATRPTATRPTTQATSRSTTRPAATRPVVSTNAPPPVAKTSPATKAVAAVGDRLPNFSLAQLIGKPITFEQLVGKPSVLIFGSYSSPEFRDQLPRIADLAMRYGSRAKFVVIYTREMFPIAKGSDQPERNDDEKIAIPAATTDADRMAAAKSLADKLKVKLPLGVDAIDDRLTNAVEGFPNAAIVADAKGVIVARWTWAEPFAIKRELDQLLLMK